MPKLTSQGLALLERNPRLGRITNGEPTMTTNATDTETEASTKEHVFVKTRYIKQLSELLGTHAAAAEKMGVAASLVSKAILDGRAKQVNELAAKCIIDDLGGNLFGAMTLTEIVDHIRADMAEARKHGVSGFRIDEAGVLRVTVEL